MKRALFLKLDLWREIYKECWVFNCLSFFLRRLINVGKSKSFLIIFGILLWNSLGAQSYLGTTTKNVNFRSGPGTDYDIIKTLTRGANIFIIDAVEENDFYQAIDIASNQYGYIHKDYFNFGKYVDKKEGGLFTPNGSTRSEIPEVEVFNNTNLELTLRLNSVTYVLDPKQTRKIPLRPGSCDYIASAPGVIPSIGVERLESNNSYKWQFYIVTNRY
jgi:hypothetical protein